MASYASIEGSETDIERVFKYNLVWKLNPPPEGKLGALYDFNHQFECQISPSLARCHSYAQFKQFRYTPDRWWGLDSLDSVRTVAFDLITQRLEGTQHDSEEFVKDVEEEVRALVEDDIFFQGEDGRFDDARRSFNRVRDNFGALKKKYNNTSHKKDTLKCINDFLRCGALAKLVKIEASFAYRKKEHSSTRKSLGELTRPWRGLDSDHSLAKPPRISARKAAIYNLNSI